MPKVKTKATWAENVRSIVDNQRTHSIVCDLSTAAGGTDRGATALELSLMALADCGVTIFADVCKKSNIELSKAEVTVEPINLRFTHTKWYNHESQHHL